MNYTFKATRTACVFDLSPTVADPCFTASIAYSIWWIRPYMSQSPEFGTQNNVNICSKVSLYKDNKSLQRLSRISSPWWCPCYKLSVCASKIDFCPNLLVSLLSLWQKKVKWLHIIRKKKRMLKECTLQKSRLMVDSLHSFRHALY